MNGEAKKRKARKRRSALRPDTALVPVGGEPEHEIYVWSLPTCCLRSLKEMAMSEVGERRLELDCSCGRSWRMTSSLDPRILERFATHGGPRVGGSYPAA